MKYTTLIFTFFCSLLMVGCKDSGKTLTSATGSIYEMLVVVDNSVWESPIGQTLKDTMEATMPCMPQVEPYFNVSQVTPQLFDDFLKATRNILYVDINPDRYTHVKIKYLTNVYSQPQAVCHIQCPNTEEFNEVIFGELLNIRNWFVRQELVRQGRFYRNYKITDPRQAVQVRFGADVSIPADYILVRDTIQGDVNLVWAVNDGGSMRRDFFIWSYPYISQNQLTREALLSKRDEILGNNVSGPIDGTYMGTEYRIIPPIMNEINVNNRWCAEVRGIWDMQGEVSMGGPFVQHTRIDEINHRVVTTEVYLFGPGQKKRNALRQAEAILYTLRLPQEINQLKEVEVSEEILIEEE